MTNKNNTKAPLTQIHRQLKWRVVDLINLNNN